MILTIIIKLDFIEIIRAIQIMETIQMIEGQKQKDFALDNNVVISSKFQAGNLSQATQKAPNHFNLWIGPDHNSSYKTWFYFSIEGIEQNTTVTFTINNMNNQLKLLKEDHLPVYREQTNHNWQRIKIPLQQNGIVKAEDGYQVTFKHLFTKSTKHYFAFSYPFTTSDCDRFIDNLTLKNSEKMFSSYENLTLSSGKRNVKILTFTNLSKKAEWKQIQMLKDDSQFKPMIFQGKKGIFISARVHPGQVASSHILNGILNELFNNSQHYQTLLQKFVFYVVPIINPDGVDEGNFRTDIKGKNLNRFYTNPDKLQEPEIYTIKKFLIQMIGKQHIEFCLDLHAHVNKQGVFMYGNSVQNLKGQVQVCLFPKILAYNSPYFDYDACNFSQKNMSSKDKSDELSKQGASRVTIFKQTGLNACWTLQCNYNSCKYKNQMKNSQMESLKSVSNGVLTEKTLPSRNQQKVFMGIKQFHEIGKSICESISDYYELSPSGRYYSGKMKNRENFLINLGVQVLRMIPFRFDNNCRKILIGINSNANLTQNLNALKKMLADFQIGLSFKNIVLPEKNKILEIKKREETKKIQQKVSPGALHIRVRNLTSQSQNKNEVRKGSQKINSLGNRLSVRKSENKISQNKGTLKSIQLAKIGIPSSKQIMSSKPQLNNKNESITSQQLVPSINSLKKT